MMKDIYFNEYKTVINCDGLDNTDMHSVGCASFVERMEYPTSTPHPQTVGLRVRGTTWVWARISTKLTHTSWCKSLKPPFKRVVQMVTNCNHLNELLTKCQHLKYINIQEHI